MSIRGQKMNRKALVVIDIQNDITKHYRDIIDRLNAAIEWAAESGMEIVYIQHNNLSTGTRTFKPGTKPEFPDHITMLPPVAPLPAME